MYLIQWIDNTSKKKKENKDNVDVLKIKSSSIMRIRQKLFCENFIEINVNKFSKCNNNNKEGNGIKRMVPHRVRVCVCV